MSKSAALLLVFIFLTASCVVVKPSLSSADATENTWVSKAPMQVARSALGVAAVNGKIYAIGGTNASGQYPPDSYRDGFVGTNEEYDPETDTWTTKASMPTSRDYFAIAAYQNKIYCIGGAVGYTVDERTRFYSYVTSGVNEVYDTVTDSWVTKASMPFDGMKLRANVVNGKIYVIQAFYVHVYDPADDTWTNRTRIPATPAQGSGFSPVSVVVDDKIVVAGEFSTGYGPSEQKVLIYDTEADSWSEGKSAPTLVVCGAAGATTGVNAPKRVYVLGVPRGFPNPINNQVYDLEADAWTAATPMPTYLLDFGVAVVNDILYLIGGYYTASREAWLHGVVTPVAVNEQYTPFGYGTVPPEISVISPENNKTYASSNVSLTFTVNRAVDWLGYSLDGQETVTINGNTTLSGLSNGLHNVTVYARDEFENTGISEAIAFGVEVPFPTPVVVASAVIVAVVGVGLLIYFKKRKR